MTARIALLAASAAIALTGCSGLAPSPMPAVELPTHLTVTEMPSATTGSPEFADRGQSLAGVASTSEPWWSAFGDPSLDSLVRQALAANPGLASAEASLRQARELAQAQASTLWPSASLGVSAVQAHDANAGVVNSAAPRSRMALVSASYSPDLFGADRFGVHAAQAQAEAARWQWVATRLSLEGAVLNAVVAETSLRKQQALLDRLVQIDAATLTIVRARESLGDLSRAAVWAQEQQVHDRRAQLASTQLQAAQAHDLLASLLGRAPASQAEPAVGFDALRLPDVALTLPGDVVLHRPDVQFASAQFRAADAQRQAAVASLLPTLALSGDAGYVADTVRHLLDPASVVWDLGASATQTLFDAGAQRHREAAARASRDAQAAQYQAVIVFAFKDVADDLEALRHDADASAEAVSRSDAAARQAAIATASQSLGEISQQDALVAEGLWVQMQLQQVQARASRLVDTVNLIVALGVDSAPPAVVQLSQDSSTTQTRP